MTQSLPEHTLSLASDLLDDIELSRLSAQALAQKATRLARLVGDDDAEAWLSMELRGLADNEVGRAHMTATGRWTDRKAKQGWWNGVGALEETIEAQRALLDALRLPNVSGDYTVVTLRDARTHAAQVAVTISTLATIRSKVTAKIHDFVASTYYELAFSERQAELFEEARTQVDALLAPLSGDTLSKVESIYRRLAEGDAEAISHALTTCRRLIDAVANAVFPPTTGTLDVGGGNVLKLTEQHVQNRLNAFVRERTDSESRRDKLRRTLGDLYGRVSSGVHSDVTADEARFLFLNTYLYLGEVLALQQPSS